MSETSVVRINQINPEINIMLSGQVVEGNLSPDDRSGRITEFSCELRLQRSHASTYDNHERSLFGCFQGYDDYGNLVHISGRKVIHCLSETTATKCFHFTLNYFFIKKFLLSRRVGYAMDGSMGQ